MPPIGNSPLLEQQPGWLSLEALPGPRFEMGGSHVHSAQGHVHREWAPEFKVSVLLTSEQLLNLGPGQLLNLSVSCSLCA
jgi:hypothetical protein